VFFFILLQLFSLFPPPPPSGPPVVWLCPTVGNCSSAIENGGSTYTFVSSANAQLTQQIASNPANYYVNMHTVAFPDGELRGQLSLVGCFQPATSTTSTTGYIIAVSFLALGFVLALVIALLAVIAVLVKGGNGGSRLLN